MLCTLACPGYCFALMDPDAGLCSHLSAVCLFVYLLCFFQSVTPKGSTEKANIHLQCGKLRTEVKYCAALPAGV